MVAESRSGFLDSVRLLVDLQRVGDIAQSFSGCLDPDVIAKQTTDGLVDRFDCAFARIWLMEPDRTHLRLVASSGLYTHTDGSFARVPIGAFKVGKIAQNRIPFLSNNLADEPWVKDREWAIACRITGFAGYPLMAREQVVGVLAVFSCHPLSPEFLEVLQSLCMTVTIALETALRYQQERQQRALPLSSIHPAPLSEQLATLLKPTRLALVGTERSLTASLTCLLLRLAEGLRDLSCTYCRFSYEVDRITLEAMVPSPEPPPQDLHDWTIAMFGDLLFAAACMGGALQTLAGVNRNVIQVVLQLPYPDGAQGPRVRIHLNSSVLQTAFTQFAYLAKLQVCSSDDAEVPLLTDNPLLAATSKRTLWLAHSAQAPPRHCVGTIDLSISPSQLREAVAAVDRGDRWNSLTPPEPDSQKLSEREQEIMLLLAEGLRDRDIANQLYISERTVKFHISNILTKLNAKTRCQAMHQFMTRQRPLNPHL